MQTLTLAERQAIAQRLSRDQNPNHRPNKLTAAQKVEICRRWLRGETMVSLSREYGVTHQVISYHVHRSARGIGG